MKLSLIVPVYKVQDYIQECLLSIVRQLPSDVEVIIINDGSPDDSMCIVEQVLRGLSENQQKQFVILNQSNQGQSVARNNAIKIAKGRYIGFLDSDDYIADNYFETILTHIEQQPNVDLFSFSAIHFEDVSNKQLGILGDQLPEGLFKNDHIFLKKVFEECSWQSWSRIVKAEIMQKNLFPENILLEDVQVFSKIYLEDITIYHINKSLVHYRQRTTSSVAKANQKLIVGYKKAILFLEKYDNSKADIVKLSLVKLKVDYLVHCFTFYGVNAFFKEMIKYHAFTDRKVLFPVIYTIGRHISKLVKL